MSRLEGKIAVSKFLVNPARALFLWNSTEESLQQIAERFCDVKAKNVRDSIEYAATSGLGDLRRPLPKSAPQPAAPKMQRAPRTTGEWQAERRKVSRAERKAATRAAQRSAAGFTDPLPAAAEYNPQVEEILANRDRESQESRRSRTRWLDNLIIEWAQFVKDSGHDEWIGKTIYPWIDSHRIKQTLKRRGRNDIWEYLAQCIKTYAQRRQKTVLEIDAAGKINVRYTKPSSNPYRIRKESKAAALAASRAEYEPAPAPRG